MPDGSSTAAWSWRAVVIVPADDQVPFELLGLKSIVVARTLDPFLPPVMRTLPFFNTVAVCPSRGLDSAVRELNADCVGSNKNTDDTVLVPLLPPTSKTLFAS